MGPEEMKSELEQFLNTGLRQGWTGWPLKAQACGSSRYSGQWLAASTESWPGGCDDAIDPTPREGAFVSLCLLC